MRPLNQFRHAASAPGLPCWLAVLPVLISCALAAAGTDSGTNHSAHPPARPSGINYMHDEVESVPWSIHIVKVSRDHADLHFETSLGAVSRLGMSDARFLSPHP